MDLDDLSKDQLKSLVKVQTDTSNMMWSGYTITAVLLAIISTLFGGATVYVSITNGTIPIFHHLYWVTLGVYSFSYLFLEILSRKEKKFFKEVYGEKKAEKLTNAIEKYRKQRMTLLDVADFKPVTTYYYKLQSKIESHMTKKRMKILDIVTMIIGLVFMSFPFMIFYVQMDIPFYSTVGIVSMWMVLSSYIFFSSLLEYSELKKKGDIDG